MSQYPAESTLNGAINSSTTTVTLDNVVSFGQSAFLVINEEIIDLDGSTLTGNAYSNVTRGALGTAAASHLDNSLVFGLYSADFPFTEFGGTGDYSSAIAAELATLETRAQTAAAEGAPTTRTDVRGSRLFNTAYHNTGTKPRYVAVSLVVDVAGDQYVAATDAANPPTVAVASVAGDGTAVPQLELFFLVLPGDWYSVNTDDVAPVAQIWIEWQ